MEDWNGMMSKRSGFSEDFEEEDIWDSVKEIDDYHSSPGMRMKLFSSGSSSTWHNTTSAPRMIPRRANSITPKTTQNEAKLVAQQSSAPMAIPDWSKIYGKNGKTSSWDTTTSKKNDHDHGNDIGYDHVGDDEDDHDDDGMVPPHEWIAKRLARSQISSFSVCEGVGRTLKGRDLSKVRNAILTKTGFLE